MVELEALYQIFLKFKSAHEIMEYKNIQIFTSAVADEKRFNIRCKPTRPYETQKFYH